MIYLQSIWYIIRQPEIGGQKDAEVQSQRTSRDMDKNTLLTKLCIDMQRGSKPSPDQSRRNWWTWNFRSVTESVPCFRDIPPQAHATAPIELQWLLLGASFLIMWDCLWKLISEPIPSPWPTAQGLRLVMSLRANLAEHGWWANYHWNPLNTFLSGSSQSQECHEASWGPKKKSGYSTWNEEAFEVLAEDIGLQWTRKSKLIRARLKLADLEP